MAILRSGGGGLAGLPTTGSCLMAVAVGAHLTRVAPTWAPGADSMRFRLAGRRGVPGRHERGLGPSIIMVHLTVQVKHCPVTPAAARRRHSIIDILLTCR
jgi:hypothetical protein